MCSSPMDAPKLAKALRSSGLTVWTLLLVIGGITEFCVGGCSLLHISTLAGPGGVSGFRDWLLAGAIGLGGPGGPRGLFGIFE